MKTIQLKLTSVLFCFSFIVEAQTPFFTDDFSNPTLWTMIDLLNGGSQNWEIGTNTPIGFFSTAMGPISSTTASNGFAMYDSDGLNTNSVTPQTAILTYNSPIDCSNYQSINLNFLSYHRRYHDSVFVEVSNDNITWERYEVHANLGVTYASTNPEYISVNISSTAGNQSTVYFRFRYEGEWDYAWMIDDVSFTETPDNFIKCSDEVFGGWWIGSQSSGDIGVDYTFYPMSQATVNPYRFEGIISNNGILTQSNMMLNVEVESPLGGTSLFSSSGNSISTGENDTIATLSNFFPTYYGTHNFKYWSSSTDTVSDTIVKRSIVTDSIYGVDYDWNSDGSSAGGGYYIGRDCGGQVLGNIFDTYAEADITSISFHVNENSNVGAQLTVEVYDMDYSGADPTPIIPALNQSNVYTITQNDIDSWKTIRFQNPQELSAGSTYLVAVHGIQHPLDSLVISSAANLYSSSWFQDNGCNLGPNGFGAWYTLSHSLLIRMNVLSTGTIIYEEDSKGQLSVFPNPSRDIFNITFTSETVQDLKVRILNVIGEELINDNLEQFIGEYTKQIDLSNNAKGIYFLEIETENGVVNKKLILQ